MNFIVNERKYVEDILQSGQPNQRNTSRDLRLITKYLLNDGMSYEDVIMFLIKFMDSYNASGDRWRKTITGIVKDIVKQQNFYLRDIQEIRITQKELSVIANIDWEDNIRLNDRLQRYAFGLLVYAKVLRTKQKDGWIEISNTSVFCKDCGIKKNGTSSDKETAFNKLKQLGLVDIPRLTGKTSVNVLFIDWEEHDDDVIIPLKDIENFKQYYECYVTCESFQCTLCGKIERKTTRQAKKYCDLCREEKKRQHDKTRQNRQQYKTSND